MLNPFKKILHRNDEDYDDIRTHVLGERFERFDEPASFEKPAPVAPAPFERPAAPPARNMEDFSQRTRDVFGQPPALDDFSAPPAPLERTAEKTSRDYEIMDRLTMIENQLAVVRSQTETINERLKNMEAKLTMHRY
jgi:hypothetical protein